MSEPFFQQTDLCGGPGLAEQLAQRLRWGVGAGLGLGFRNTIAGYRAGQARAADSRARLDPDELADLIAKEDANLDPRRKQTLTEARLPQTLPGAALPLLETLLAHDPSIRTVLNLAVRYALADAVLAREHPGLEVIGLSLATTVEAYHADLARDNLTLVHAYPLDWLAENPLSVDVALFCATATKIRPAELRAYLAQLTKRARYVVLNEPIYNDFRTARPIDPDRVTGAAPVREFDTCLVHNYRGLLAEVGYQVRHWHIAPLDAGFGAGRIHLLQAIAERV